MKRASTYAKSVKDPSTHPYPLGKDEVARLYYEECLPLPEVAAIAGTSRQRLARWMEFWGLPRRTGTEGRAIYCDKRQLSRSPNWQGGQWKHGQSGTWYTYAPHHPRKDNSGAVATHILVAEARIGRYLRPGEVVHHLDKDRDNNAPDNLCVMLSKEHLTLHRMLGDVGIALYNEGFLDLVLRLIPDGHRRRFVRLIYSDLGPCVSGLLDSNAGSDGTSRKTRGPDEPEVRR